MPRDGSGHSHNEVEDTHTLAHGAPTGKEQPTSSGVDRSDKAAPMPDHEAGEGLPGTSSGQASITGGSGKGPITSTVDEEAQKKQ